MTEFLGWLGNVLFFAGAVELARRRRSGFAIQGIANVVYTVYAVQKEAGALAFLSAALCVVNGYGFCNWRSS